ncbi:MAG: gamma-glutamyltransferase, partial [Longimicrobiales bacterium]
MTSVALLAAVAGCEPQGDADETAAAQGVVAPDVTFPDGWAFFADTPPVTADEAMVSTTDAYATEVGLDVLRNGGNAVDAAVAVSFALAVVHPSAGNIGGGGFLVTRSPEGEVASLDYREKAPLAASRDMFLDDEGNLTDRSVVGHLAAGVPGSVDGLETMHERYGTLSWA